ncbi:VOC family protein [Streptomyces sp. NPDC050658]|uniref:VOC family protein n=1 Tax=unclassified Streptomyces TaxID=2593676 RepID=UPI0034476CF0
MSHDAARPATGEPTWVDLLSPDREAALHFYATLFGWEFNAASDGSSPYTMCLLRGREVCSIGDLDGSQGPRLGGWTSYLTVEDADAAAAAVPELGGTVLLGPIDILAQGRMLLAGDPSGHRVGLWQAKEHTGSGADDGLGAYARSELLTGASLADGAFYRRLFGDGFAGQPAPDGGRAAAVRQVGPASPSGWYPCFRADESAIPAAAALGAQVLLRYDVPDGRAVVVRAPGGEAFTLLLTGSG